MVKVKKGLPAGFDLNIGTQSPAILGDFLDEIPTAPLVPEPKPAPAMEPRPLARQEVRAREDPVAARRPAPAAPVERFGWESARRDEREPVEEKVVAFERPSYPKPPRLELSLNHETKRMVQELLTYIHSMGPQPAATTSEMFQGAIFVLHRAKEFLDLSAMPRRGQWGSPTAKAFPIALGQAFAKAIAEQYSAETVRQSAG